MTVLARVDAVFDLQIFDSRSEALGGHVGTGSAQDLSTKRRNTVSGRICELADVIDARTKLPISAWHGHGKRRRSWIGRTEQRANRAIGPEIDAAGLQGSCLGTRNAFN